MAHSRGTFDVAGHLVKARRVADLSQRELADVLGVSQPTVARWEAGAVQPTVDDVVRIVSLAGHRLTVVDDCGEPVRPMPAEVVRDNAGRRFPAHLDVVPADERPVDGVGPRLDRLPARAGYSLRPARDEATAPGVGAGRAPDHPTEFELEVRRQVRRQVSRLPRSFSSDLPVPLVQPDLLDCTCPIDCEDGGACPESCPCRCEPGPFGSP